MTRSRTLLIGAVLATLWVLPAASTLAMDKAVALQYLYKDGCVTNIRVQPLDVDLNNPKNVYFTDTSHRLRFGASRVVWWLVPRRETAEGVTWSITRTGGDYDICRDTYTFNGTTAICDVKNHLFGEASWEYTVSASKDYCPDAVVDPEIIFRKGGGGFLPLLISIVVLLLALVGVASLARRWWRRATP